MLKSVRFLAPAAAVFALAASPAQARPAVDPALNSAAVAPAPAASADDFEWGSAALGAGGMAGLVMLFAGAGTVARRVRLQPTR
jgi:hypothetical protein